MNNINFDRQGPELPEVYATLERIGQMAERGLNLARRYTDEVSLPIPPVMIPSLSASALLHMEGTLGGREIAASWAEMREATHWSAGPIIDAAFKVATGWGHALWCVAENIPVEFLPETLAEAETTLAAAIVELEIAAEACLYPPTVLRPGAERIAALVGDRGMAGAKELLLDLFSYVAEQDSPAEFAINGIAQWDGIVGEETGEMWCTPSDMDASALLAAIKMQVLSRHDDEDIEYAWHDIEERAKNSVEHSLRAFLANDAETDGAEEQGK